MGARYLEGDERILYKQKLEAAKPLSREELSGLFEQTPNTRFFGIFPVAPEVYLYHWGVKNYDTARYQSKVRAVNERFQQKRDKASRQKSRQRIISNRDRKLAKWRRKISEGNWRMRQGRPAAVFDSMKHIQTIRTFNQYLMNWGYFGGYAFFKAKKKGKNYIKTRYRFIKHQQYRIDSISYDIPVDEIRQLISENAAAVIRKGDPYNQSKLSLERDRIYELLSDNGFFNFSRDYIFFEVDTISLKAPSILLKIIVADPCLGKGCTQVRVDSVAFVESDDTNPIGITGAPSQYDGVTFLFGKNTYNKELLKSRLLIEKDQWYSRSNTLQTQRQLSRLDAFKFVNINYDTTGNRLTATVLASPLQRYETANEVGLSSTAGLPGPFANVSLKNRNIFHGLEILTLQGNFNLQGIGNIAGTDRTYSLFQFQALASLTLPQFLFPVGERLRSRLNRLNPKTSLSLSFGSEDRFNEYKRETFNAAFDYTWQTKDKNSYTLSPLNLSYVLSTIGEDSDFRAFLDRLVRTGNEAYPASFESTLLTTASVNAIFNRDYDLSNRNSRYMRLFFESAGNLINTAASAIPGIDSVRYQYLKFEADFRRQTVLNRQTTLAARLHIGAAFPYGQPPATLPYEKFFYIGGSNSLRAWPPRRLGPGGFSVYKPSGDRPERLIVYNLEQGGSLIIESSVELRRRITDFVSWAVFVDAGNIWQIRSNPLQVADDELSTPEDAGLFRFRSFASEIAAGAGVGLRIDFGYLIFRVDGAVQVLDPGQPAGSRFVLDNIDFLSFLKKADNPNSAKGQALERDRAFFRNKTRVNIGIGFPF